MKFNVFFFFFFFLSINYINHFEIMIQKTIYIYMKKNIKSANILINDFLKIK